MLDRGASAPLLFNTGNADNQLREDDLGLHARGDELEIRLEAGVKSRGEFLQRKPLRVNCGEAEAEGVDAAILFPREMCDGIRREAFQRLAKAEGIGWT